MLLSILRLSNDDDYLYFVQTTVVNYLSCLFIIYSLIALRTATKNNISMNEDSNALHDEDFDDEMDNTSDNLSSDFCRLASLTIASTFMCFLISKPSSVYSPFFSDTCNRKELLSIHVFFVVSLCLCSFSHSVSPSL